MSQSLASKIPKLRRGFRLQFEPVQNCHVLLYPEGVIKLNDSAGEILQQVNGAHSVDQIIDTLRERFPDVPGLDEDILAFMEVANAQFWIELH